MLVGQMKNADELAAKTEEIYRWIDEQIRAAGEQDNCSGCGKCCDFKTYGHRLYITTPEMIYFTRKIGHENIKPMSDGVCPYLAGKKCSVHKFRFSGCRIYNCKGDSRFQNELSEQAVKKFKNLCEKYQLPYRYTELSQALNKDSNKYSHREHRGHREKSKKFSFNHNKDY
jgi:Fe-S-cluster containining protein